MIEFRKFIEFPKGTLYVILVIKHVIEEKNCGES